MRRSCPACIKVFAPETAREFGAQTVNHLVGAGVAFVEGLQTDIDEAAIGGAPAARERHDVLHGRIRFDDIDDARS